LTQDVFHPQGMENGAMATTKQVRRSVTLPTRLAEQGLEAQKEKEKAFFVLAKRFRATADPKEAKELGDEIGRFIFGE